MALEHNLISCKTKRNLVRQKHKKQAKEVQEPDEHYMKDRYLILGKHRYKYYSERRQHDGTAVMFPTVMTPYQINASPYQPYESLNAADIYELLEQRKNKQNPLAKTHLPSQFLHQSIPLLRLMKANDDTETKKGGWSQSESYRRKSKHQTKATPSRNKKALLHHQDSTSKVELGNKDSSSLKIYDISRVFYETTMSSNAGLDLLYDKISSGIRILHDIQAGNSLLEIVQIEKQRKEMLEMLRARTREKTEGKTRSDQRSSCTTTPRIFSTTNTRFCLVNVLPDCMKPKGIKMKKMALSSSSYVAREPSKARIKINFFAKMKSIYSILCFLHNASEEDLISNEPMAYSHIKRLCRRLQITLHIRHPYVKKLQDYMHFQRKQDGKIGESTFGKLKWSPSCEYFPTPWELLEYEEGIQQGGLPAWKRKLVILQSEKESTEPQEQGMSNSMKRTIFKTEIASKLKAVLRQHEKVQLRAWSLKSKYLSYGPILEKQLKDMRRVSYRVRWEEGESIIPEWMTLLVDEMNVIFENEVVMEEHKQVLQDLQQFLYMKTRNLPYVVEKLSLLVMSLPVYYLGIREVHLALELVCKHILKCSPILLSTLRTMRKIPPVVELRPPKYLFGHLIYSDEY